MTQSSNASAPRPTPSDDPVAAGVDEFLVRHGIEHEWMACDPALADTAAFCEAYGVDPGDSANTIVVIGKVDPPVYVACIVLATTRLDVNGTVRRRLGVRKASFGSAEETKALTGMEIGGVTAFGLPEDLPIWIDAAVVERPSLILGGGSRNWKLRCPPAALVGAPGVEVVDGLARLAGGPSPT